MPDQEKQWFEIIRYNFTTKQGQEVARVRGITRANQRVDALSSRRTLQEIDAGIDYHRQKGGKPPRVKKARKLRNKRRNQRT
jgi:hypothetical protein